MLDLDQVGGLAVYTIALFVCFCLKSDDGGVKLDASIPCIGLSSIVTVFVFKEVGDRSSCRMPAWPFFAAEN